MKERITITIDRKLLDWLDKKVGERVFANRSHGLEFLMRKKSENENEPFLAGVGLG